ncbi:MAG: PEP-CTERM sorting domain-containing protein [Planctomycetales bacterium]|nr:PEP-CTERM sorting domain-containing protein [Planctomycetales bacterium]
MFKADYEADNGTNTFAAMVAAAIVPEPSTLLLFLAAAPAVLSRRLLRSAQFVLDES